jgi:hypothetical protein
LFGGNSSQLGQLSLESTRDLIGSRLLEVQPQEEEKSLLKNASRISGVTLVSNIQIVSLFFLAEDQMISSGLRNELSLNVGVKIVPFAGQAAGYERNECTVDICVSKSVCYRWICSN